MLADRQWHARIKPLDTKGRRKLEPFDCIVGESGNIDGYSKSAPYKPFDPMAEAKRTVKGHKGIGIDLKIGDRVNHKKFGEGIVLESNGKIGKIAFDSVGIKKLDLGIAPMEKL